MATDFSGEKLEDRDAFGSVEEGDRVRLKFLYPNGTVEVMDGTWITRAGTLRSGDTLDWVVIRQGRRVLWKPLQNLIQIEIVQPNAEARRGRLASRDRHHPGLYHN